MGFHATNRAFLFLIILVLVVVIMVIFYFIPSQTHPVIVPQDKSSSHSLSTQQYFDQYLQSYWDNLNQLEKPEYHDFIHVQYGPPAPSEPLDSGLDTNVKRILLWTEFFLIKQWIPEVLCPGQSKSCVTSIDKNDILKSDAVLIHPRDLSILPSDRLPSQRWVYFIQESPYVTGIDIESYNGVFNWTATFRLDSDFPAVYYQSVPLNKPLTDSQYREQFANIMIKKKKVVVGAISNCDQTYTKRIEFLNDLKKFVSVDFFGYCGDITCAKGENCTELFSEYKFFLSFENANCRDYITEKVRNPLHVFNAVPIVMGGAHPDDYIRIMPPNSFIHYQGFASVKELAEFITFLDRNDEMYEHYHRWRRTHDASESNVWCDMCQALHNRSLPSKIYSDFGGWYEQDICKSMSLTSNTYIVSLVLFALIFSLVTGNYFCKG